jgi:hypothetical protein
MRPFATVNVAEYSVTLADADVEVRLTIGALTAVSALSAIGSEKPPAGEVSENVLPPLEDEFVTPVTRTESSSPVLVVNGDSIVIVAPGTLPATGQLPSSAPVMSSTMRYWALPLHSGNVAPGELSVSVEAFAVSGPVEAHVPV